MRDRSKSERQRNILRYMENYIETHGFPPTIREIGLNTGINSTSVVNYNLNKLVEAGHLSREARASRGLRLVKNGRKNNSVHPVHTTPQMVRVRLAGQIVASAPAPIPDDMESAFADDAVEVTPSMLNGAPLSEVFALRVKGDSMIEAGILDADVVVVRRAQDARDGEIVVALAGDDETADEATVKRFFRESGRIRLQPENSALEPIYAPYVQILGKVVGVFREL